LWFAKNKGGKKMLLRKRAVLMMAIFIIGGFLSLGYAGSKAEAKGIYGAAFKGDLVKVKKYLKKDASLLNSDGWHKKKPLHWAAQGGHLEVAKLLISRGAKVDSRNVANETPLIYAVAYGHKALVELLVAKGADVNAETEHGTVLSTAVRRGQAELAKYLISKGADATFAKKNNWTILHDAAWSAKKDCIQLLLDNGAKADVKSDFGRTPIQNAAMAGNLDAAILLIKKGADVNYKGKEDLPPLYMAAKQGYAKMTALLLKAGASVDIKNDKWQRTPLHLAALKGYGKIAHMLLEKGADPHAEDVLGMTPLAYAGRYGHKKVAKVLLSKGAKAKNIEKLKKSFGYTSLLKKEFKPESAMVWYLRHSAWAVKTANNLLIFDYFEEDNMPDTPVLTNGSIDPEEIKDLNVTVFSSHSHGDHYTPKIFKWKEKVKNITYVMGFKPEKIQDDYIYMAPHQMKKINGMKVATLKSNDSGVGFYVIADGVKIFHSGDHANRKQDFSGPFKKEIDFFAEKGLTSPDIFFAPVSGCGFGDLEAVKKGVYYTMKKLKPGTLFPMHASGNEYRYVEFAKGVKKAGFEVPVCNAGHSGDWFFIHQGKVKKANTLFKWVKKNKTASPSCKATCKSKSCGK
jgi:ankyrin repeat protein